MTLYYRATHYNIKEITINQKPKTTRTITVKTNLRTGRANIQITLPRLDFIVIHISRYIKWGRIDSWTNKYDKNPVRKKTKMNIWYSKHSVTFRSSRFKRKSLFVVAMKLRKRVNQFATSERDHTHVTFVSLRERRCRFFASIVKPD